MTRGRKPNPKTTRPASPKLPAEQLHVVQLATAAVTSDALHWGDARQQAGQMQMAVFLRDVADRALVEVYAKAKESKAYVGMPYVDGTGKPATVATLEQYCAAFLGKSYRRCEELLANRHLLGPEMYELAEKIGLTQRNYNDLKSLPAPAQELIKAAIESEQPRKQIVEQLVTLVEQQESEKAALQKSLAEKTEDHAATAEKLGEIRQKNEKLKDDLTAEKTRWRRMKPDEQRQALERAVLIAATSVRAGLNELRATILPLLEHGDGETGANFTGRLLAELLVELQLVRDDETLPVAIPIVSITQLDG